MKTQNLFVGLMILLTIVQHAQGADRHERSAFWSLSGNRDTVPTTNFLGTIDHQALELKVNGSRALRLEPHTNSPNVIGGYKGNFVTPRVTGATISGGGGIYFDEDRPGVVLSNVVSADFGSVGGGNGNQVQGVGAAIAGGQFNRIETNTWYSFVGGGVWNTIQTNAALSVVGGGQLNTLASGASVIGGGIVNAIEDYAGASVVSGGFDNRIQNGAVNATIGGGGRHRIQAASATIPGGTHAKASSVGQFAYASGRFDGDEAGQAQTSLFVLRQVTTDSTAKELFLDHPHFPPRERMNIPSGAKWSFDILVVGVNASGETASFQVKGAIKNVGTMTKLVGVPSISSLGADTGAATWSVWVEADATHQALVIKVSGGSTTIRWVASVRTVEVVF
jgi:hypothetical protein